MNQTCRSIQHEIVDASSFEALSTSSQEHISTCESCQSVWKLHTQSLQLGRSLRKERERELFPSTDAYMQRLQARRRAKSAPAFRAARGFFTSAVVGAVAALAVFFGGPQLSMWLEQGKPQKRRGHAAKKLLPTQTIADPFLSQEEPSALDEALARYQSWGINEKPDSLSFYDTWSASLSRDAQTSLVVDDPAPIPQTVPGVDDEDTTNEDDQVSSFDEPTP
ncbi:MAG: hypothetical protein CL920_15055 [Deltaproteobacteria bacterium]|nr:hypothetical protein [Deltaproteobacteria bacterium]|tara:strand:+ start:18062 stop:18727 length:666 start_codon:yes stop_codon:yes gene_type:complete